VTGAADALEPRAAAGIGDDLALLARLHDRELDAPLIAILRKMPVDQWFALRLEGSEFTEATRLLDDALKSAPDPLTAEALDEMAAEYAAIYLNHTYRISPHESVWVDEDGLERQEPMFRVRAAYWQPTRNSVSARRTGGCEPTTTSRTNWPSWPMWRPG